MNNRDIFLILSPLTLFLFHLLYLIFVSSDHFLNKWIDGCFTFFLALVLCNIIRARVVASKDAGEIDTDESHAPDEPGGDGKP